MDSDDYIPPSQCTKVRVFHNGWEWEIDAADEQGSCTEVTWTHYNDLPMTREVAIQSVPDFCKEIGRPDLIDRVEIEEEDIDGQ